jgi:hypothetical protein
MKYRKLPVIIDAEVYREGLEDGWILYWSDNTDNYHDTFTTKEDAEEYARNLNPVDYDDLIVEDEQPYIKTLEGNHLITKGDYIITGVKGERYPCKADIFAMTYEKVEGCE